MQRLHQMQEQDAMHVNYTENTGASTVCQTALQQVWLPFAKVAISDCLREYKRGHTPKSEPKVRLVYARAAEFTWVSAMTVLRELVRGDDRP